MATLDNYYEMLLSGVIKTIARVELLRKDESVYEQITGDLIDGSLTINKQNGVRRSVNLTLRNRDKRYLPNVDGLWVGTKFRLLLGYDFGNNDYYFFNQGVFIITNPSITSNGAVNTISLNGVDKFALYDGQYCGVLNDNVHVANGTNVNTAIKNIITDVGTMGIGNLDPQPVNFDPFSVNISYTLRKDIGGTVADAINELAFYGSRNLYYNSDGLLTFEEDFDDTTKGSIWNFNGVNSYQKGESTVAILDTHTYQGMTKTPHLGEVYNVIKVIGTSVDGSSAVAIAKNTNPLSDTNINTIGERFAKPIDDSRITTSTLAQKRADFELKKLIRLNATLNISSLPMYHLDVDEVITVTDTNTNDSTERYVIQSINIPFGANSLMSITATNVKELALEVTV